ncbi:MAG: Stk1 family PASTA domain-containing Ser/Thr kinase [Halanaerobium sp.]
MQGKILNNRYKIIKEIGRGGMAIVYSARDTLLERVVALKMLRPEYSSDKEFKEKFRQEAKAVAKLSHPNIVSIYDIVVDEDKFYLVMEIVEGETLKDIIKRRAKLSIAESLEFAGQIAAALSIAHGNQIVHCDIKPQNIILTDDMEVKITDFGIAKAVSTATTTMTETVIGSAHYFSPEQAKGGKIKAYSDIYSLGVVLYEMTTGELPFHGESPISVALKHIQQQALSPSKINSDIPKEVNDLIMKAISKNPEDRFQNAAEMRHEIRLCLKNLKKDKNIFTAKNDKFDLDETRIMDKAEFKELNKNKGLENKTKNKSKNTSDKDINDKDINKIEESVNNAENGTDKSSSYKSNGEENNSNNRFKTLKKAVIIFLVFLLGLSAVIAGAIYFFNSYTSVPIVEVPDIEGESLSEARSLASEVGLSLSENEERVFNDEIPVDHVVSQQPAGGQRVKQSRPLNVTVSKGPKLIELPDFSGNTLREVLVELENLSLKVGNIQYIFRLSVEPGIVINQIPAPGAEIASSSEVTLFVSRGERSISVRMPDLTGLNQDEAVEKLRDVGLNVGDIRVEKSDRFLDGQVISQGIEAGDYLPKGISVDFVVSQGIDESELDNLHLNRISVNVTGSESREVKIVVIDESGEDEIYNAVHQPGDNIVRDIRSRGETEIEIYFDDQLVKSEKFGG